MEWDESDGSTIEAVLIGRLSLEPVGPVFGPASIF